MRKTLLSTLVVAVLLGTSPAGQTQEGWAQDLKPLVTLSFSGYGELLEDIEFIGKLGDAPGLGDLIEEMLKERTNGQGLAGLDKKRPWGVVIQTDGQGKFPVYGFIPVTDLTKLLDTLKSLDLGIEVEEVEGAGKGIYKIQGALPVFMFITERNGWALLSDSPEGLGNVPDDPIKLLHGMHEKYDLAARVSMQNIPEEIREEFQENLKLGAEMGMQRQPGEGDEQYALRTGVTENMIDQITALADELDEVLLGWAVDRETGTSYLDLEITALEGTGTAGQFAEVKMEKTNFAGFDLPDAALSAIGAGRFSDEDVTQLKRMIADVRSMATKELEEEDLSDEELEFISELLGDVLDVAEKTVDNRKIDGGAVLVLKPRGSTFVVGGLIAETAKVDEIVKKLVALANEEDPELAEMLKLNAETHQGVRFHVLNLPTPEEDLETVFGDEIEIVLGIGPQSIYLSAGADATATLKQVIDLSKSRAGKEVPPMRISLAAVPFIKLAAEEQPMIAMMLGSYEKLAGKDHVTLTVTPIENGIAMRLELEEGILKLIGSMGKFAQMAMGAGAGPPAPQPR